VKAGIISQVLDWLRAGYPEGVPPQDYHPLLALMRRTLTAEDLDEVVAFIERENPDEVHRADLYEAIGQVTTAPPNEHEVRAVAARLAAAGWPLSKNVRRLADAAGPQPASPQQRPILLDRVVGWLRAGYPQGVPYVDYLPLLALLRRQLSEDEARDIAERLIADGQVGPDGQRRPISAVDAQVLITKVTQELPDGADVARVRAHLAAQGWPLEG
jgi:hypothetical protein